MENQSTTVEETAFAEKKRHSMAREAEARSETRAKEKEAERSLTGAEKAAFGMASVFSGVILVICVMLTIVGFIFSPITQTLVFGLLAAGAALTSYVIWRGGKRYSGDSSAAND